MKILVWDLENSAINADVWTLRDLHVGLNQINQAPRVICWAAKWVGSKTTMFRSEHHHGTQDMLETMWNLWDEADVFVHYNGTSHDLPHMRREFLLAGMPPPKPIAEVDLLKVVRREFKFPSNRLAYVSDVLGLGGKAETGGHGLWTACMAGDDKAWAKMRKYCLTPDHKLLDEALRWRPISDFKVGDVVLGFEEHKPDGHGRQYRRSTILSAERMTAPLYKVTLASGKTFRATPDHGWLTAELRTDKSPGQVRRWHWKTTERLKVGDSVPQLFKMWDRDESHDAGWLAGMMDGEGTLGVRRNPGQRSAGGFSIAVSQKLGPEADRMELLIKEKLGREPLVYEAEPRGPISKLPMKKIVLSGPMHLKIDFLGRMRPERLISKVDFDSLGRVEARNRMDSVVSIERIADGEIVALETDTATFIADGYPMHNCKRDVEVTEQLYLKLRPWARAVPNVGLVMDGDVCPGCGSTNLEKRGFHDTQMSRYQRWRCRDCGRWPRSGKAIARTDLR